MQTFRPGSGICDRPYPFASMLFRVPTNTKEHAGERVRAVADAAARPECLHSGAQRRRRERSRGAVPDRREGDGGVWMDLHLAQECGGLADGVDLLARSQEGADLFVT